MAFTKLHLIVSSALQEGNRIGFTNFPEIRHRNVLILAKTINPKTKVAAFSRGSVRQIHAASFVNADAESKKPRKNLKDRKLGLPKKLSQNVVVLTCDSTAEGGKCDVYLVGTNHVAEQSCTQVKAIINHLKPQIVFLELCEDRAHILTENSRERINPVSLFMTYICIRLAVFCGVDISDEVKKLDLYTVIFLIYYDMLGEKLKVVPGSEFRVAYEEANKYGAEVILGDRPQHITVKRGWGKMSPFDKTKCCFHFMSDLETLGNLGMEFPTIAKAMVDERDQYMSSRLLEVASKHNSVVAVVGMGHLHGIKEYWKKPIVIEDLLELPQQ